MSQADLSEKESEEKEKAETQQTQNPQEAEEAPKDAEAQNAGDGQETETASDSQEVLSTEEIQDKAEEKVAAEQEAAVKPVIQVPLAPRCVNPIIGRKVFFVNPLLVILLTNSLLISSFNLIPGSFL
jgi:hypothetical protein